jgi:hypothetical protein
VSLKADLKRLRAAVPKPDPMQQIRQRYEQLRRLPPEELRRRYDEAMANAPPSRYAGRLDKLPADVLVRLHMQTIKAPPERWGAIIEAALAEHGLWP